MPRLAALFFHSIREESRRMAPDFAPKTDAPPQRSFAGFATEPLAATPPRSASWLDDALKSTPFHPETAQGLAALAAALLYVALYPVDKLAGLPSWLGAAAARFAILSGARAAASGATGMDMLGGAFRRSRTGQLPERVDDILIPESIEQDIARSLDENNRVHFALLRASLDPAQHALLIDLVRMAFTDVGLLHSQYYCDPRIVDYVAQHIAGVQSPAWDDRSEVAP
jgi:hypothetical protein